MEAGLSSLNILMIHPLIDKYNCPSDKLINGAGSQYPALLAFDLNLSEQLFEHDFGMSSRLNHSEIGVLVTNTNQPITSTSLVSHYSCTKIIP